MNLLLDTNILLLIARDNTSRFLKELVNPDNKILYISIASLAEIKSIAVQNDWGITKLNKLDSLLQELNLIEITDILLNTYIEIDTFSQCKNPNYIDYSFETPRNMGKNDLWIAATASLLQLTLVTTDNDFDHLHNVFLKARYIDISQIKDFLNQV
jgi:tRNA(fMet)-specific endonuclease VapC